MMKRQIIILAVMALMAVGSAFGARNNPSRTLPGWTLAWEENFDGPQLDPDVWGRCTRARPDWANTMSVADSLLEFRDGVLILRGVVNGDLTTDTSPYLTGGIWTRDRKVLDAPCRVEVRARLHGAKGAWPAIWMLSADTSVTWPYGGEIDIMERLNNNHYVYQTVHSNYTVTHGRTTNPRNGSTAPIDREGWNTYGVEIGPDSLTFLVNGSRTFTYTRIYSDIPGQYPFCGPMYLLIDNQLGGQWVGDVDPGDLPVEMEVDWVRYYVPKEPKATKPAKNGTGAPGAAVKSSQRS